MSLNRKRKRFCLIRLKFNLRFKVLLQSSIHMSSVHNFILLKLLKYVYSIIIYSNLLLVPTVPSLY